MTRYFAENGEEITLAAMTDAYHTNTAYFAWKRGEAEDIACLSIWLRGNYRSAYTVMAGLKPLLEHLTRFRFTEQHLRNIAKRKFPDGTRCYEPEFVDWLRAAKPTCKITSVRDGDILFPGPVINIIGPKWFIKRLGTPVTNHLRGLASPMTKAVRVRDAAGPVKVWADGAAVANPDPAMVLLGGELRRTNDLLGMDVSFYTLVAGFNGTSNEAAEFMDDSIQAGGTVDHFTMMDGAWSADTGTRGMQARRMEEIAEVFPNYGAFLPDTNKNIYANIDAAVAILAKLKKKGQGKGYKIRIDSGNLAALYKYTRAKLDAEGLLDVDVQVFLSGGIKALTIRKLVEQGVPRKNVYVMVGEYLKHRMELPNHGYGGESEVNVEFIDKLSAIEGPNGTWIGRMKLAEGKLAYPGVLERLRMLDTEGRYAGDVTVDASRFEIPEDGVLKEPLTSIWRYSKPDGTLVNKDYTFPVGTKFLRTMVTVFNTLDDEPTVGWNELTSLKALRDFTATALARLPEVVRDVTENHDNYGSGIEQSLWQRANTMAENDEISTEFFDLAA